MAAVAVTDEVAMEEAEMIAARMERVSLALSQADDSPVDSPVEDSPVEDSPVEDDDDEANLGSPGGVVDVSDAQGASSSSTSTEASYFASWAPRGYLMKRSPAAANASLLKRLGWQKRWFVVNEQGEFCWYASAKAAEKGLEPLGRVPLTMILTATAGSSSGCFEVDLGNRKLELKLDGVPNKDWHAKAVKLWIEALVKHEQVQGAEVADPGADSHRAKFWKVRR